MNNFKEKLKNAQPKIDARIKSKAMANIWKGKPKAQDREISSSCPPRRIDIPRVDMKEIFGQTPWRNPENVQESYPVKNRIEHIPTEAQSKARAPSPPQQAIRKPLESTATPPTPPTVASKKAERVNTPPTTRGIDLSKVLMCTQEHS